MYSASLVVPVTAPTIRDGAVAVSEGRIIHVGQRQWVLQALEDEGLSYVEEHWEGTLTPGLINAHTHLQYTLMAEVGRHHYLGFDDWSAAFDRVYEAGDHDWLKASLEGTRLALESGTTAAADVVTDLEAAPALAQAGMHGIAYWEVMGWSNQEWRQSGRAQTIAEIHQIPPSPGVGVSPHAPLLT
ncbi:amidohydrolase family protein [Scrofimicrobium canadense]|uniref:amidohydrolase family protein n=1 Tax=Scrofimicrobium canadense TaxID=2652290 RepID=UPI00298EACC5|nr:amidohydrolase family protein [Scrofimicrobium canadense]